jgi:O-antigen/teichoic acid export membrane protein
MVKRFSTLASCIGLDQAVLFSSLARVIQAGGGIVTMLLISLFFTTEEQGFYFTFSSVLAIQIFFELGLGGIVTQFVAHEVAFLKWTDDGKLIGESKYLSRLGSIVRFCLRWYVTFGFLLSIALIGGGYWFFNSYSGEAKSVEWQLPWVLVSFSAGLNLIISPVLAILQGLGKVKEMARVSFVQQLVVTLSTWVLLYTGGGLFVLSFNFFISFLLIL